MIDKEILKKHNLKAVPFSCIGEGETFQTEFDYGVDQFTRRLIGGNIYYADNKYPDWKLHNNYKTVYVPVWRVTN
jgi:hypothetical protein